jgi:hypothetical protein
MYGGGRAGNQGAGTNTAYVQPGVMPNPAFGTQGRPMVTPVINIGNNSNRPPIVSNGSCCEIM